MKTQKTFNPKDKREEAKQAIKSRGKGVAHMPGKHNEAAPKVLKAAGGKDLVITTFNDAPASTTTSDDGGKKLRNVKVNLIFWGDAWNANPAPNPNLNTIVNDVAGILGSSYLARVTQYGCTTVILGGIFTTPAGDNPPTNYTMGDVNDRIVSAIHAGSLPEPDEESQDNLHVIFMPPGTILPPMLVANIRMVLSGIIIFLLILI